MLAPIIERRKLLISDTPMSVNGVVIKTAFLLGLTTLSGVATFWYADVIQMSEMILSALTVFGLFFGLVLMLIATNNPDFAKAVCVPYALCEGVAFGALSAFAFDYAPSIPLNAFCATIITACVMLGLYTSGVIKVTKNFRAMVTSAITALMVLYAVQILLKIFGYSLPLLFDGGIVAIGFSLASIGLASCYLVLDFDEVEQSVALQADNSFEWFYAMSIVSALTWIYTEFLRLFKHLENASF